MKTQTESTDFRDELKNKIKAGIPIIQIVSYEWKRVKGLAANAAKELGKDSGREGGLYLWYNVEGLMRWDFDTKRDTSVNDALKNPCEALEWFRTADEARNAILLMEDLHVYFDDPGQSREILGHLRAISRGSPGSTLLLAQPFRGLPPELEKVVYVLEVPLPDRRIMETVMDNVLRKLKMDRNGLSKDQKAEVVESALGLTEFEADFAFTEVAQRFGKLSEGEIPVIVAQKEQIIRKSGMLEYFHPEEQLDDVGGLEPLKEWLRARKRGFEPAAREFGITSPKGVLLLGVQGCGKSLVAKAVASDWKLPLLKFDLGKVFSSGVGESEANIRKALDIARAIAPSILWIDEIEKALAGVGSSDRSDAGTTARVFATMLTWMQEKKEPVFVIATANNIEQMPSELLRKGRFDEIFFVDLPGPASRKKIWQIHLQKRLKARFDEGTWRKDLESLAKDSAGYSGAEIEEAVNEGLYRAYNAKPGRDLNREDISAALQATYPLSKVMADRITKLREWARVRARSASDEPGEAIEGEKRPVPRLRQEADNPFIED